MTAVLHAGMPDADQLYRIAQQVRYDYRTAPVHRVVGSKLTKGIGFTYQTRCGQQITSGNGVVLTTRRVTCPRCTPGWKAGPT